MMEFLWSEDFGAKMAFVDEVARRGGLDRRNKQISSYLKCLAGYLVRWSQYF